MAERKSAYGDERSPRGSTVLIYVTNDWRVIGQKGRQCADERLYHHANIHARAGPGGRLAVNTRT